MLPFAFGEFKKTTKKLIISSILQLLWKKPKMRNFVFSVHAMTRFSIRNDPLCMLMRFLTGEEFKQLKHEWAILATSSICSKRSENMTHKNELYQDGFSWIYVQGRML